MMWSNKEVDEDMDKACRDMLFGERLGSGSTRVVYQYDGHPDMVIKACTGYAMDANVMEMELWEHAKLSAKGRRWLAECDRISYNGRLMLQEKLDIITSMHDKRLPKRIPSIFADTKATNWGVNKNGVVKCCDYGVVNLLQKDPWKLVDAEWWELEL